LRPRLAAATVRRLFFALWPDRAAAAALHSATVEVAHRSGGRPVPLENLHVTLVFLGAVADERLTELGRVGATVAENFQRDRPLTIRFDRLVHWARARVLCVTARAQPEPVLALATALTTSVGAAGFAPDLKPFRAHVTIARKVPERVQPPSLTALEWQFDGFALVDSRTEATGPVYSVVESWPLVNAARVGEKARE
jgi:RNA 2',3'-cyclic 3'-phosphodiesterase